VALAFPQASVELWATDEHRIGRNPLLKRVWTLPGQRPLAPVDRRSDWRSDWRYLVAFVHPASGRTIWRLATGVSAELFSAELAAFAAAVGAGPSTSTCSSSRPIRPSCSPASIFGRSAMLRWSTAIFRTSRSLRTGNWRAVPCCSADAT
jgi:hypothetical protein